VRPRFNQHAADDHALREALDAVEEAIQGRPPGRSYTEVVTRALQRADRAARYSEAHGRYRNPAARAAAHVCQGILYVLSPARNNRLQGLHDARNAIEYAGLGYRAIRAELDWQLARVRTGG
jgi:hypothetical protein